MKESLTVYSQPEGLQLSGKEGDIIDTAEAPIVHEDQDIDVGTSFRPEQAEGTDETEERVSIINVAPAKKESKIRKTNVMPTWAATIHCQHKAGT